MNKEILIAALGQIDDVLIQKVNAQRGKHRRQLWVEYIAAAACFGILFVGIAYMQKHVHLPYPDVTKPTEGVSTTPSIDNFESQAGKLLRIGDLMYENDWRLSQTATQDNVGERVDNVSFEGKVYPTVSAYRYLPEDGKTNRLIVPYKDSYYVYTFGGYAMDITEDKLIGFLQNASYIEVRDPNYGIINETIYKTLTDKKCVSEMVEILSNLGRSCSTAELNQRFYEMFKDSFADGMLWIDENGDLQHPSGIHNELSDLICGEDRMVVVFLKDQTYINYHYMPGSGVIRYLNFNYLLDEQQMKQISQLIK